jgi:dihydrolipoamide dehydrogenase
VVIIGGGPGGYEAALVAVQLGASVTVVDRDGLGGAAVLTDCVPSKALIATSDTAAEMADSGLLGLRVDGAPLAARRVSVDLTAVNRRILELARAQSDDIGTRLSSEGVTVLAGSGRLAGSGVVLADLADGSAVSLEADVVLLSTGARPRTSELAQPDGERILTWQQIYELDALPERLIVVGSGVTGAELAGAYNALGSDVVLVSSREHVLPGEDADAAHVIEDVFNRRGLTVLPRSRMASVTRSGDAVMVTLTDGRTVEGTHALLAIGSLPNTESLGLDTVGVETTDSGHVVVDRVSRTSARGVYAAGDVTGVLPLASVAAMQGRIAMWHALGDAVSPLNLRVVSSTVFTYPEIATVGYTQREIAKGEVIAHMIMQPLSTNARAKMQGVEDGFVKLFARPGTKTVIGGVVVAPKASELIHPIAIAVEQGLTVDQLAQVFTVYPSLSGSIAEAARRLHTT